MGALDPLRADHNELARIVPEKVEAFSNASMVMLDRSAQTIGRLSRLAQDEAMTTARATVAMATCANPAAPAERGAGGYLSGFSLPPPSFTL